MHLYPHQSNLQTVTQKLEYQLAVEPETVKLHTVKNNKIKK